MSALTLKIIAIVAMVIDHLGYAVFDNSYVMRAIGRLTFPIMAFFIAEGFRKTSNVKKYLLTMFGFAFISEIPFNLLISNNVFNMTAQNVLFTFAFALLALYLYEQNKGNPLSIIYVVLMSLIADLVSTDYSGYGVYLVFFMHFFKDNKIAITIIAIIWTSLSSSIPMMIISRNFDLMGMVQLFALLALPFIFSYNGKKGYIGKNLFLKYSFYLFYPVHMLLIWALKTL